MRIVFSAHANLKTEQRKLSREKILATVSQPDGIRLSYNHREELVKVFGRRNLQVVIKREPRRIIVVTAHWIARFPKK